MVQNAFIIILCIVSLRKVTIVLSLRSMIQGRRCAVHWNSKDLHISYETNSTPWLMDLVWAMAGSTRNNGGPSGHNLNFKLQTSNCFYDSSDSLKSQSLLLQYRTVPERLVVLTKVYFAWHRGHGSGNGLFQRIKSQSG
jgi:hypothetical protein